MSDIDVSEDHKLLQNKTASHGQARKTPSIPLARIDSVNISEHGDNVMDSPSVQTDGNNFGTSLMSQGFVNEIRQQLKVIREMSTTETPK